MSNPNSNSDWWYIATKVAPWSRAPIAHWVLEQEWPYHTVLKKPSDYHVTLVYSYDGRNRERTADRAANALSSWDYRAPVGKPRMMTPADGSGRAIPVVLPLLNETLKADMMDEQEIVKMAGYRVSTFDEVIPHVTVALVPAETDPSVIERMTTPDFFIALEEQAYTGGLKIA